MKSNVGSIDKVVRYVAAILFAVLYFTGVVKGMVGIILLVLGAVFILTASINFCPIYSVFGISTKKKDK